MGSRSGQISSRGNQQQPSTLQEDAAMPIHSGLSALILAASSLLRDTGNESTDIDQTLNRNSDNSTSGDLATSAYGEGDLGIPDPGRTPRIVSEIDEHDRERRNRIRQVSSFPETLMTLLLDERNNDTLTFLPDGKFFAVRAKEFSQELMRHHFSVSTFDEFLELIDGWGFSRINHRPTFDDIDINAHSTMNIHSNSGIYVFRHPRFEKGHPPRDLAKQLTFTHPVRSEQVARVSSGHPDRAPPDSVIASCYSSDGDTSAGSSTKRRLSPGHLKDCEESFGTQKRLSLTSVGSVTPPPNLDGPSDQGSTAILQSKSQDSADTATVPSVARRSSTASRRASNEVRSLALAITTSRLNLSGDDEDDPMTNPQAGTTLEVASSSSAAVKPLIDGAVERATHTIVTDAIETLLRDEGHTRQTYLKHEKELSQSALPGVIPISKQLFSPNNTTEVLRRNTLESFPATIEAASDKTSLTPTSPPGIATESSYKENAQDVSRPSADTEGKTDQADASFDVRTS